jgi:alpha-galactosidase
VRFRARLTGEPPLEVSIGGPGTHDIGPLRVEVHEDGDTIHWSIATDAPRGVAVDAVALVWDGGLAGDAPIMFVQGYQSWAPTRAYRLGIDEDSSRAPGALALVHAAFHADPAIAAPGELRSEQVTVLSLEGAPLRCIGFAGGERHAGTIRARVLDSRVEVTAEAWLGGARLDSSAPRTLHDIVMNVGDDADTLLAEWARRTGETALARTAAPLVVGWCSWYHYFERVAEQHVNDNLTRAQDWPFDVFQLDDGYQHAIGDWLRTNARFPSGIEGVADAIARTGCTPGIWIAPFLAAPGSDLAGEHPEWLAGAPKGDGFAIGMYNEPWGGVMAALDVTQEEVLDHLSSTAAALVSLGFRYLKLDFTFSAAMPGRYADPTRTPAERVRAGYDAIRKGAGDDAFLLGCGAPIGATVGVVDAMRIGADVAPWWDAPPGEGEELTGYEPTTASTHNAFVNTCTRSFMHRRLWSNDPDCIMLRTVDTRLSARAAEAWARTVACSGGLVLVSDDLALLGAGERRLLDEVIAAGRAADDAAIAHAPPRCDGLLDPEGPHGLTGAGGAIRVDPTTGARLDS